jgi:hypothetical protein
MDLVSWMATRVLDWTFSGKAQAMPSDRSVIYEEQLDFEAAYFCREALGLSNWPKSTGMFQALHALLEKRSYEQFCSELEYDPDTQRLTWTPVPKETVADAVMELQAHMGFAWETPEGGLTANAVELEPLFETYYGQKLRPNVKLQA